MSDAGWAPAPYNEKNPWGKGSVVITSDNAEASKARHEAIKAVNEGRATPDQRALVDQTDATMAEAVAKR